jgi:hypothetical protein
MRYSEDQIRTAVTVWMQDQFNRPEGFLPPDTDDTPEAYAERVTEHLLKLLEGAA